MCVKLSPENNWEYPLFLNDLEVNFSCPTESYATDLCLKPVALSKKPFEKPCLMPTSLGTMAGKQIWCRCQNINTFAWYATLCDFASKPYEIRSDIGKKRREILKNCPTGRAKNLVDLQPDHQVKQTDHLQLFMQIQFPQTLSYLMAWQSWLIGGNLRFDHRRKTYAIYCYLQCGGFIEGQV